jgi:hypothetical protein
MSPATLVAGLMAMDGQRRVGGATVEELPPDAPEAAGAARGGASVEVMEEDEAEAKK